MIKQFLSELFLVFQEEIRILRLSNIYTIRYTIHYRRFLIGKVLQRYPLRIFFWGKEMKALVTKNLLMDKTCKTCAYKDYECKIRNNIYNTCLDWVKNIIL